MVLDEFHTSIWNEFLKQKAKGKRNEIEFLRSALWFAEVKRRLKVSTAYKVGKKLEPGAFGTDSEGNLYHSNLYSKYKLGKITPNKKRVALAEEFCPGTSELINHVLWEVLETKDGIKHNVKSWLRNLSPDIQTVVFKINPKNLSPEYERRTLGLRELKMLRRRSGIDALACLTILLKEASEAGQSKEAMQFGRFLYDILLTLCVATSLSEFTKPLMDIFERRIFSLISHRGLKLDINVKNFIAHISMIQILTSNIEQELGTKATTLSSLKVVEGLVSGLYGYEISLFINPINIIDERIEDKSLINYENLNAHNIFRSLIEEKLRVQI